MDAQPDGKEGQVSVAKATDTDQVRDGIATVVPPGAGPSFWVGNELVTIKVSGRETGGALVIAEHATLPHGGPPLHLHHREDETVYVLEGEFLFREGERTIRSAPGMSIYLPRGRMHSYTNRGDGPGTLLVITSPAGLEEYFAAVGQPATTLVAPPPPPTPGQLAHLAATARRFGVEIVGPPLG
jgi:mannose-6-phosphate isomerase-like protein (cupin superfamily)